MHIRTRLQRVFGVDPNTAVEWLLDAGQLEALNLFFTPNKATIRVVTYADQNFVVQSSSEFLLGLTYF